MKRNNGFDQKIFTVVKEKHLAAYIPGVGRYCKCGCERLIIGRKDKVFFNPGCRRRYYGQVNGIPPIPKHSIHCSINIKIIETPFPHRKIILYLNKGNRIDLQIIPEYKELWNMLEKIAFYRQLPIKERIVPMNILSQVNLVKKK